MADFVRSGNADTSRVVRRGQLWPLAARPHGQGTQAVIVTAPGRLLEPQRLDRVEARGLARELQQHRAGLQARNQALRRWCVGGEAGHGPEPLLEAKARCATGADDRRGRKPAAHRRFQRRRIVAGGVIPGKPYNSMQQRIRAQAKKHNLKVIIRFDADDMKLYFKASHGPKEKVAVESMEATEVVAQEKTEVKASEIKGVKTKATQPTSK